jgi:predicted transcriptional regulator of viral defense system
VSIRRGLYATIPRGSDPLQHQVDPFLIAAKLTEDAVLSYHTALEFHGRAYSVQEYFTYASVRPLKSFVYRGHVFRGVHFPQALCRQKQEPFGVIEADRSGTRVQVTNLERTFVDTLHRPDLSGSWEEIWRSLESIQFLNLEEVLRYTELLTNATTAARVGFFLEQHKDALMINEKDLAAFLRLRPRHPTYMGRRQRQAGRLVTRWNLVVPPEVLERSWGTTL